MCLYYMTGTSEKVYQHSDVGYIMSKTHEEKGNNKSYERPVISSSNTIICPFTVMVEVSSASLTRTTMFRLLTHMCFTNTAYQREGAEIKIIVSTYSLKFSFFINHRIGGVYFLNKIHTYYCTYSNHKVDRWSNTSSNLISR